MIARATVALSFIAGAGAVASQVLVIVHPYILHVQHALTVAS